MTDLFLSYKAEDRARVAPLVEALEADGYTVWWDADIGGGEDWRATICRHLDAARCVVVVWSKRSVGPEGHFVRDEATRALRRGVYLPVTIDKVQPPLGFGETQALNLQGWRGDRSSRKYQALIGAVRARAGDKTQAQAELSSPSGLDRRSALIGGGTLAVATAGFGAWAVLRRPKVQTDSIAVLPFANLSGDPAQAYFSDGIAEELRSVLSRIPGLKVVARTSSEAVRDADAKAAAARLHVHNILTGSVRRSARMIRVTAQLVDGPKGVERWSDVYDRPFGDALQIQTDIANMVAQALSLHLRGNERTALQEGGTRNPEAHDMLLRARSLLWREDDTEALHRALELVDRALSLDPRYADALAAKASLLEFLGGKLATSKADFQQKYDAAEKTAREAVRLAPRSASARATLANILYMRFRMREALDEFAVMEKLPGEATSYLNDYDPYVWALSKSMRFDEASARAERLIATDPLNPYSYFTKATVLAQARRYAEGEEVIRQAIVLGPDLIWPRAFHAFFLMQMGQLNRAQAEFKELGGTGPWVAWAAVVAERQGNRGEADRLVSVMQKSMGDSANYQFAQVWAQQGQKDRAIEALERGWRARDPGLTLLQVDPMLDPLREEPRFQALLRQLDFPT